MARETPTKIIAAGADIAADTEHSVTIGTAGDSLVYHIKALYLDTNMTIADVTAFQITTDTDVIIWSSAALTAIATTAHSLQAHRGIAAGFTDGDGNEVVVLPDKMIVPGGYKVKTLAAVAANIDHGVLSVFGSVLTAF
ncbi:hypothetical protein LCGC14_0617770 [marine sediment metagenome]|uniref:Uncharacterized protein n=1 Tax=marine sediment metagenome TaxID=412755 RepID=A0A0F9R5U5_9ZZZZ